jgi:hypothetical protein
MKDNKNAKAHIGVAQEEMGGEVKESRMCESKRRERERERRWHGVR